MATSAFAHVDSSSDPQWFVNCLDRQYAVGNFNRAKQRTIELLDIQPGHQVLDAGCGTGVDTLAMATLVGQGGHISGIDLSQKMITAALERSRDIHLPISFHQADICQLQFGDNTFDRCRSDKTFQHLREPQRALQELVRVLKPGAKLAIADPDHDSLIIDTPYKDLNRRFVYWRSDAIAQGGIAHQQYRLFQEVGLVNVTAEPITTTYTDYEQKKVTSPYLEEIWYAQESGIFTAEEADKWVVYLKKAIENGRFFCMQTYIITVGVKPS